MISAHIADMTDEALVDLFARELVDRLESLRSKRSNADDIRNEHISRLQKILHKIKSLPSTKQRVEAKRMIRSSFRKVEEFIDGEEAEAKS